MLDTKPAPSRVTVTDAQPVTPKPSGLRLTTSGWRQWLNGKDGLRLLRIAVVLGLIGFVIVPIVATIVMGSRADFELLLANPAVHDATRNSLVSSAMSALAATALGVGFAVKSASAFRDRTCCAGFCSSHF